MTLSLFHRIASSRVLGPIAGLLLAVPLSAALAQTAPPKKAAPAAKPAAAQNLPAPKQLGNFDAWTSVELAQESSKICYMFARPAASEPTGLKRGDVMFTITNRPAAKRF